MSSLCLDMPDGEPTLSQRVHTHGPKHPNTHRVGPLHGDSQQFSILQSRQDRSKTQLEQHPHTLHDVVHSQL